MSLVLARLQSTKAPEYTVRRFDLVNDGKLPFLTRNDVLPHRSPPLSLSLQFFLIDISEEEPSLFLSLLHGQRTFPVFPVGENHSATRLTAWFSIWPVGLFCVLLLISAGVHGTILVYIRESATMGNFVLRCRCCVCVWIMTTIVTTKMEFAWIDG